MAAGEFRQIMKRKLSALSGRYVAALQKHLEQSPRASLAPARRLGRQAVAIGLETLDVARIHERALARLELRSSRDGFIERADIFFTETITPIEETHRAELRANRRLNKLNKALSRRTAALGAANKSLTQGIARRKTVELALNKSREHHKSLLKESLALQKHLRQLTYRTLLAQEDSRKKIGLDLQNEIAQTLLGINVRLLTVKQAAGLNAKSLLKELGGTERLVNLSAKTIKAVARGFGKHHEP